MPLAARLNGLSKTAAIESRRALLHRLIPEIRRHTCNPYSFSAFDTASPSFTRSFFNWPAQVRLRAFTRHGSRTRQSKVRLMPAQDHRHLKKSGAHRLNLKATPRPNQPKQGAPRHDGREQHEEREIQLNHSNAKLIDVSRELGQFVPMTTESFSPHHRQSVRRQKGKRQRMISSPSLHLDLALTSKRDRRVLPRRGAHYQHDLTFRLPQSLHSRATDAEQGEKSSNVSLQSITAKYIRAALIRTPSVEHEETHSVPELSKPEQLLLVELGYTDADPILWAKALSSSHTATAVTLLIESLSSSRTVPWFVMNYLLRRNDIGTAALDGIGVLLQHYLADESLGDNLVSWDAIMIVCIRMIRHARNVWPQSLPQVIDFYITNVLEARRNFLAARGIQEKPSVSAYLTFQCNRLLSQLSLQGARYPNLAAAIHQRAQFQLLRSMLQHTPSLPLNREGHRSLTRVLAFLAKTPQERDWALLKARTWPPFKVSKTQFDEAKDREYGTSTAGQSIEYTKLYGYAMRPWDHMAQLHTGWHPDGSPTVQVRSKYAMKRVPTSNTEFISKEDLEVAEILCTRTVPEAWAAFLKYDQADRKSLKRILAMFERLPAKSNVNLARPADLTNRLNAIAVPGDGKEVYAPPTSPREQLYLPSEPPDSEGLFDLIRRRGYSFGPSWRTQDAVVEKASNLHSALRVLNNSPGPTILTLLHNHLSLLTSRRHRDGSRSQLRALISPDKLALIIRFLTTSVDERFDELKAPDSKVLHFRGWHLRRGHPFIVAYELLLLYQPEGPKPWLQFFRACTSSESLNNAFLHGRPGGNTNFLVLWLLTVNVVERMKSYGVNPDAEAFHYICSTAIYAAIVSRSLGITRTNLPKSHTSSASMPKEHYIAMQTVSEASNVLRQYFVDIVGSGHRRSTTPSQGRGGHENSYAVLQPNLQIPRASALHVYVRALGILEDHEGIYSFVCWLAGAAGSINEIAGGELNGQIKMRRTLIAIRVFMECPSEDYVCRERSLHIESASAELVHLVRMEIESLQYWGGWPTDDEVTEYTTRTAGEVNKALKAGTTGHTEDQAVGASTTDNMYTKQGTS